VGGRRRTGSIAVGPEELPNGVGPSVPVAASNLPPPVAHVPAAGEDDDGGDVERNVDGASDGIGPSWVTCTRPKESPRSDTPNNDSNRSNSMAPLRYRTPSRPRSSRYATTKPTATRPGTI